MSPLAGCLEGGQFSLCSLPLYTSRLGHTSLKPTPSLPALLGGWSAFFSLLSHCFLGAHHVPGPELGPEEAQMKGALLSGSAPRARQRPSHRSHCSVATGPYGAKEKQGDWPSLPGVGGRGSSGHLKGSSEDKSECARCMGRRRCSRSGACLSPGDRRCGRRALCLVPMENGALALLVTQLCVDLKGVGPPPSSDQVWKQPFQSVLFFRFRDNLPDF